MTRATVDRTPPDEGLPPERSTPGHRGAPPDRAVPPDREAPPERVEVDGRTWSLHRSWPKGDDLVLVELVSGGERMACRWFDDPDAAARAAARTTGSCAHRDRLVLHPDGADRRLPRLAPAVAAGARLLVHRPERRAVTTDGRAFHKFVRAGRGETLVRRHAQLAAAVGDAATVPEVTDLVDDVASLVRLPGRELAAVGADPSVHDAVVAGGWSGIGTVLHQLRHAPAPADLPVHDATAEAEVTAGWVRHAVARGHLPPAEAGAIDRLLAPLRDGPASDRVVAHRDLHDGQVLIADRAVRWPEVGRHRLGLLDPDTLAVAEPALDLANLLVHLDLRRDQGALSPARHTIARAVLLTAAAPDHVTLARVPAHTIAVRLRLAAVHAFRPRWRALARRWYLDVLHSGGNASIALDAGSSGARASGDGLLDAGRCDRPKLRGT